MIVVWFAILTYVFPVLARFYGTIKQTITNAFLLSVRYLFYTIAMIAVDLVIVFFTLTSLPVLSLLGFALIAFLNSYFLEHIFKKFIPKDDRDDQELRPLFSDTEDQTDGEGADYSMFVRTDEKAAADTDEAPAAEEDPDKKPQEPDAETADD